MSYLISKEIISESRYGFCEKHSTEHTILDIISKIQASMDKMLHYCAVFIDLSKAFERLIMLYYLANCITMGLGDN